MAPNHTQDSSPEAHQNSDMRQAERDGDANGITADLSQTAQSGTGDIWFEDFLRSSPDTEPAESKYSKLLLRIIQLCRLTSYLGVASTAPASSDGTPATNFDPL
jgi:hypothetical protein